MCTRFGKESKRGRARGGRVALEGSLAKRPPNRRTLLDLFRWLRGSPFYRSSAITERRGETGERIFSASDVNCALDFVQSLAQRGIYQFFRGQERAEWYPLPSYLRLDAADEATARERVSLFCGYLERIAQIGGIAYSDDALVAVAQHYGLPTQAPRSDHRPRRRCNVRLSARHEAYGHEGHNPALFRGYDREVAETTSRTNRSKRLGADSH